MPTTVERRTSDVVAFVPTQRPSPLLEPLRILHIEDSDEYRLLVGKLLLEQHVVRIGEVVGVATRAEAIDRVVREPFDVLIVDLGLPDSAGTELLSTLALQSPDSALVVATMSDALEVAVECIHRGAAEFVPKDELHPTRLGRAIALAVERKTVEIDLRTLGLSDELTGLGNRRALDEYVARFRSSGIRPASHLGLVVVDLDEFKRVNDEHGHLIGDEVLRAVGDRLRALVRSTDLVVRLGGDEFVVGTVSKRKERIRFLERRLLHEFVSRPIEVGRARVSAAVGGALMASDESIIEVLARADKAMYAHKAALQTEAAERPRSHTRWIGLM